MVDKNTQTKVDELKDLKEALKKAKGDLTETAKILGIRRAELYRMVKKHSLFPGDFK